VINNKLEHYNAILLKFYYKRDNTATLWESINTHNHQPITTSHRPPSSLPLYLLL